MLENCESLSDSTATNPEINHTTIRKRQQNKHKKMGNSSTWNKVVVSH